MAAFRVEKVYYVQGHDLLALQGTVESGKVLGGMAIDLPREVQGPGWVPIRAVQQVPFAGGVERTCVLLDYEVITGAPFMEFSSLEGLSLQVRPQ